jgi:amidohydrolase
MNITIYGKGGHGASPQSAIDPIVLAAEYINNIQTIVSRNLSNNDPAVITVGAIHGGTLGNIIPDQVQLKLTIRSFSETSRQLILKRLKEIGDNMALSAGLSKDKLPTYNLLDMSIPAVFNNPELGMKLKSIIQKEINDSAIVAVKPIMIGEDFSVYGQQLVNIPSYMIWMGSLSPQRKKMLIDNQTSIPSLHSSKFAPDYEAEIPAAIKIMITSLLNLFKN